MMHKDNDNVFVFRILEIRQWKIYSGYMHYQKIVK